MPGSSSAANEDRNFNMDSTTADAVDKLLKKRARNCESVKKSYNRKKKYIQDLEELNQKLTEELNDSKLLHSQYLMLADKTIIYPPSNESDLTNFGDLYKTWFVEHGNLISRLRKELKKHHTDMDINPILIIILKQFKELFILKHSATKDDVLNIIYGNWMTPAERCIMWIGGFRPSDIARLIIVQVQLTSLQTNKIKDWETHSIREEIDLANRMMEVQTSIAKLVTGKVFLPTGDDSYYQNYMSHMAMPMGKLSVMEDLLHQADQLREKTIDKMHEVLTTKQFATAFLAIYEFLQRITALSVMWINRPKV